MVLQIAFGFEVINLVYNDTVSIFDSVETDDGLVILQYILSDVFLETSSGVTLVGDGEKKNYNASLIIPKNFKSTDKYVKPKIWERLSFEEKLNHFTLRSGQIISRIEESISCESFNQILNEYDDSFTVIGVETFDKVLPHFEVVCK